MGSKMENPRVQAALEKLSRAAQAAESGWVPAEWVGTQGGIQRSFVMSPGNTQFRSAGIFEDLALTAHAGLSLSTRLDLPGVVHGVPIGGEPLQLTVNSLRPVDVFHDDKRAFGDHLPVVASGPALIELVPATHVGDNGELRIEVLPSPTPLDGEWGSFGLTVHLTTPSLRERFRLLDLAHARLLLASAFADTEAQHAALETAVADIPNDLEAVPTGELVSALGDSRTVSGMSAHLGWLDASLADYRVHCVGHSHIDLAWLWTYDDTREVIFRDFRSIISLFEDYPEFRFTHSQARGYAEVEASEPVLFRQIKELVQEGRLEPATMQWVESDVNLPSGVAQVRQLLEGVTYTRSSLETEPHVFLAPDTFGHAGNLPQLAIQAGATTYYHHRANPGFAGGDDPWPAYWWIGDDGTRLLALSTPVYLGPVTATRLANDLITLGKSTGLHDICYFYGVGDHGGGPTREDLDAIRALNNSPQFPAVACATVSEFAGIIRASGVTLPEFRGESDRVFEGCYITHADGKRMNRELENALTTADTLAAVSGTGGSGELRSAWRKILHHQFHDILGGSAVAGAFEDQRQDSAEALKVALQVTQRALKTLSTAAGAGSWVVTNPTGLRQLDAVTVRSPRLDGKGLALRTTEGQVSVPTQEAWSGGKVFNVDLAGLGSAEYRASDEIAPTGCDGFDFSGPTASGDFRIETPYFSATLRGDSGIVTDLVMRDRTVIVGRGPVSPESRRQLRPDLGLGVLVITHERPHGMTAWVADENDREHMLIGGAETRVIESGPVRIVFETKHSFGNSKALLRTVFYGSLPWVDYELEVDWQEIGTRESGVPGLALSFGTKLAATEFWTESPFGVVRRAPDGYLVPALRWVDLGSENGGITLANDGKYGMEALGPRLRVHVLRSAYEPDPRSDAGRVDVSKYRVHPHLGPWQQEHTLGLAVALNQPMLAYEVPVTASKNQAEAQTMRPRVEPETSSIVLAGMETVDNGVLLRIYESQGVPAQATLVGLGDRQAVVTDLLGHDLRVEKLNVSELNLELRPFEVRTVRLD